LAQIQGSSLDSLTAHRAVSTRNTNTEPKYAMLSVLIFLHMAAQADAILVQPKHNAAETPLRTHVPSKDLVNATSAVQLAAHQGLGEYGMDVERTKHALKDDLRLRAMNGLQDRLQKTKLQVVKEAASADAGDFDSVGGSTQKSLESSLMDKGSRRRAPPRRRRTKVAPTGTRIGVVPNSPLCRKEYPNLELWAGNEGDRCRTTTAALEQQRSQGSLPKPSPADARSGKGSPGRSWSCPVGCVYTGADQPRCVKTGTREVCTISAAIVRACGKGECLQVCRTPHPFLKSHPKRVISNSRAHSDINKGDYCHGATQNWFPPRGCEMSYEKNQLLLDIGRTTGSENIADSDDGEVMEGDDEQDETNESDAVSEGTKNALKDDLRLRAMHRLQDRLQKTKLVQVQSAASADAGVTDSFGSSKQRNLESSLMDKGSRRRRSWSARRRRAAAARRRRAVFARRRRALTTSNMFGAKAKFPWTWLKGKTGWSKGVVCHVDRPEILALMAGAAPDTTIRGLWRLVASSTHGASVQIQTGFSSSNTKSATKSDTKTFSQTVSASAAGTVGGTTGGVGVGVNWGGSSAVATTAESTIQQSKSEMVSVHCPDEEMSTKVTTGTQALTSHSSVSVEYVYQWVVANSDFEAKTQNFRCHRVADGVERPPQCSPQYCGSPFTNPYCVAYSASAPPGADQHCTR